MCRLSAIAPLTDIPFCDNIHVKFVKFEAPAKPEPLLPRLCLTKEAIEKGLGERAIIPEGPYHIPQAGHLGLAGLTKQPDTTHALTPNYLRLAEAEANWLKAQKENENHG